MSKAIEVLAARPLGAHPVTVGTSHALEALVKGSRPAYDPERKVLMLSTKPYDEYWINIYTVARNIVQSVGSKDMDLLDHQSVQQILSRELEYIKSVVSPIIPVVFYYCEYSGLARKHKNANFKVDSTEKSKRFSNLILDAISAYVKEQNKDSEVIKIFSSHIEPDRDKNVILTTSHAYDLIDASKFNDCVLLESNTGAVKKKPLWHTKLSYGNKNPRLPFNYVTIQIYGDSQLFRPIEKYLRDAVDSISERFEWTYMTTVDRMRYTLSRLDYAVQAPILDLF
jgi:hypothetical protein